MKTVLLIIILQLCTILVKQFIYSTETQYFYRRTVRYRGPLLWNVLQNKLKCTIIVFRLLKEITNNFFWINNHPSYMHVWLTTFFAYKLVLLCMYQNLYCQLQCCVLLCKCSLLFIFLIKSITGTSLGKAPPCPLPLLEYVSILRYC